MMFRVPSGVKIKKGQETEITAVLFVLLADGYIDSLL